MKNASLNARGIAAAAVLAGTMAFAPVSALATTVASDAPLVNKTWTAASNAQLNDSETFKFQLDYKYAEKVGTHATADPAVAHKTVELSSKWLTNANGGTSATANLTAAQVFEGINFSAPGKYHFTLKEVAGNNANIAYSGATYDVVVTVSMPDDYPADKTPVIQSVIAHATDGTKDTNFQNTPVANSTLKVSKTVAGTAANTEDEFNYTLKINDATGSYDVEKSDGTTAKVEAGVDYAFKLKDGENIQVKNLPEGATYTVTEADTDYDESNKVNGTASANGRVATGTIAKQNEVAYLNKRGFAADTGITMNVIPYVVAGGVVVAGAATLVISRHRRANEEF